MEEGLETWFSVFGSGKSEKTLFCQALKGQTAKSGKLSKEMQKRKGAGSRQRYHKQNSRKALFLGDNTENGGGHQADKER